MNIIYGDSNSEKTSMLIITSAVMGMESKHLEREGDSSCWTFQGTNCRLEIELSISKKTIVNLILVQ